MEIKNRQIFNLYASQLPYYSATACKLTGTPNISLISSPYISFAMNSLCWVAGKGWQMADKRILSTKVEPVFCGNEPLNE